MQDDIFKQGLADQMAMPDLLLYLWEEYKELLKEKIKERNKNNKPTLNLEEAIKETRAITFVNFARSFLNKYRPVENFFVDANHGIKLSNNDSIIICPGIDLRGTMQDAGSVGITQGRSQQGNDGVSGSGDIQRII